MSDEKHASLDSDMKLCRAKLDSADPDALIDIAVALAELVRIYAREERWELPVTKPEYVIPLKRKWPAPLHVDLPASFGPRSFIDGFDVVLDLHGLVMVIHGLPVYRFDFYGSSHVFRVKLKQLLEAAQPSKIVDTAATAG